MSYLTCAQWHSFSPCCSHMPCRFSGSRPQKSYLTCFQWHIFFPCCRYAFQFSRSTMQKSYLYKNAFSGPSLFLAAPISLDFPGQKCENPISRAFSGPSFSVAAPMSHLDFLGQNPKKISHVSSRAHRFPLLRPCAIDMFWAETHIFIEQQSKR